VSGITIMSSSSSACAQIETSRGEFARADADFGFEPLPRGRDEVDHGDRRPRRLGGQTGDVVEDRLGRRIENVIAVQRGNALVLAPILAGRARDSGNVRLYHPD